MRMVVWIIFLLLLSSLESKSKKKVFGFKKVNY